MALISVDALVIVIVIICCASFPLFLRAICWDMKGKIQAEYIWLDGNDPQQLRSKTRVIKRVALWRHNALEKIPSWGFDGSSTKQAEGSFSDCKLKPVHAVYDPIRGGKNILVMCEVFDPDGSPHKSNTRAKLREVAKKYEKEKPWFGIEQEYTLFDPVSNKPLAWSILKKTPEKQGKYYCAVGAGKVFGRNLIEAHTKVCLKANLEISGTNVEVMPGQWEFQVGPVGPLEVSDQLWIARWLLHRLGEDYDIAVSLHPKPKKGDWNGAGLHTNFSTKGMRENDGLKYIERACRRLGNFHEAHMIVYGKDNDKRMTGEYETSSMDKFRFAHSDRGASVRIPMDVWKSKKGYLEDRRPAANGDPYLICAALLETICGDGFKP